MIDFNRALQETRQMIEPPDMGMIRFNNWAKRQNAMAQVPQDEDWQAEQRNTMFMDGYRPNSSLVPGVSTTLADPQGFNRSSGVGVDMPSEQSMPEADSAPEVPEVQPEEQAPEQEQQSNAMFAAIQEELQKYDDGTYQYAMSVLQKLPTVFAKYENADPSRAMPYFLAGQPGRQRETEMVRFNEFMR